MSNIRHTRNDCIALATLKNGHFLSDYYINAHTKYIWQCEFGHKWKAKYNNIQQGQWCPVCGIEKYQLTNLKRYGCISPFGNIDVQKKIKKVLLEKYGVDNPLKNEFIKKKFRETCLKKYGCEYPARNNVVAKKTAKSQNNSSVLYHWKTGEELVCVGSYEKKVVEYLNKNRIEYEWQNKIFYMPDGKTYRPDFYLTDANIHVEIKGYFFRADAKKKWKWFHKEYPNSELWDSYILKEMGLLKKENVLK